MLTEILVYPEAVKKLQQSGLEKRILDHPRDDWPDSFGMAFHDTISAVVQDLARGGYYKSLPPDFAARYKQTINGISQNPEKFFWSVEKPSGVVKIPLVLEQIRLLTGEFAAPVLKPNEMWDYRKFGFDSATELVGTISAYVLSKVMDYASSRDGYKWVKKDASGLEIVTEIGGSPHADLRIFQTDIAQHPVKDPFGNAVHFRPLALEDTQVVSAYHSTESALFVAVLKYIDQCDIQVPSLANNGSSLLEWAQSLNTQEFSRSCAEHYDSFGELPDFFFVAYGNPIPIIGKNGKSAKLSSYRLFCESGGVYGAYLTQDNELLLAYKENSDSSKSIGKIDARFTPADAEDILKGLMHSCVRHLGRTPIRQLVSILEYRFSHGFEAQQRRLVVPKK